jgi:hypothetical protein
MPEGSQRKTKSNTRSQPVMNGKKGEGKKKRKVFERRKGKKKRDWCPLFFFSYFLSETLLFFFLLPLSSLNLMKIEDNGVDFKYIK